MVQCSEFRKEKLATLRLKPTRFESSRYWPPAPLPARRAYRPEGRAYASERKSKLEQTANIHLTLRVSNFKFHELLSILKTETLAQTVIVIVSLKTSALVKFKTAATYNQVATGRA